MRKVLLSIVILLTLSNEVFGSEKKRECIGSGAYADVFKIIKKTGEARVHKVFKYIPNGSSYDDLNRRQQYNEITILQKLQTPDVKKHFVQLLDYWWNQDGRFTMEFELLGSSLRSIAP